MERVVSVRISTIILIPPVVRNDSPSPAPAIRTARPMALSVPARCLREKTPRYISVSPRAIPLCTAAAFPLSWRVLRKGRILRERRMPAAIRKVR